MELLELAKMLSDDGDAPARVEEVELRSIEKELNIAFPQDYFDQIVAVGLPLTSELLDLIADQELELRDLWSLYAPKEILRETEAWRPIGLPNNLVIIGSDCMGNKFCFDINELSDARKPQASIFFWDHDFDETEKIAGSFSEWISQYLAIVT